MLQNNQYSIIFLYMYYNKYKYNNTYYSVDKLLLNKIIFSLKIIIWKSI